ncbi:amine oxidase [Stachybotrys elegans]|uniref:Amine oxidase n=1 Tax=Stachybotrys elegans TaxID=80388 RepID=A0A8K0SAK8_9HYPO|nr:amine oxidase [Stachybotrys elegans]
MRLSFSLFLLAATPSLAEKLYDAIIIGGGVSGLSAAKALSEAGKSFIVLEARNRTSGRAHTVSLDNGGYVDVGGTFLGPTQDMALALVDELGIERIEIPDNGNNVLWYQGDRQLYPSTGPLGPLPPIGEDSLWQVFGAQTALNEMAAQIDVQNPWNHPDAKEWDAVSLKQWLDSLELNDSAMWMLEFMTRCLFSVEADELSLLYTVAYVAAGGNESTPGAFERLTGTTGGAQMWRMKNGAESIARGLTNRLGSRNIALNSPVTSVTKTKKGYDVKTKSGKTFKGAHVIVAMSPPLAARIRFTPPLPPARQAVQNLMRMGAVGKGIAVYDTPFWTEEGLTGQVLSDAGQGRVTYDLSSPQGEYGAIMAFMNADEMRDYIDKTDEEITEAIETNFVSYFGERARNATEWSVFVWNREEYSLGGPTAVAGPGIYSQYGAALKQAVGNIHFAGTESSDYWVGYMDGAIRAGYRAAAEVIGA